MLETLADFFLMFSHEYTFLAIVVFGFLFINRALFFQLLVLAAFEMIVNVALKGSFRIPPNTEAFDFPSGHMQISVVFYLFLALYFRNIWFRIFVGIILIGVGYGLIYKQYHDLRDVLGSLFFGTMIIGLFYYGINKYIRVVPWIMLIIATCLMGLNHWLYTSIPPHTWVAYYVLLALVVGEFILAKVLPICRLWIPCDSQYQLRMK